MNAHGQNRRALLVGPTAATAAGGKAPVLAPPPQLQGKEKEKGTRLQIDIRAVSMYMDACCLDSTCPITHPQTSTQADRSDTKALVDFVLKCEGEWTTAGHAKK